MLNDDQVRALQRLQKLWGEDSVVLIGAVALDLSIGMNWRETRDLDLVAAVDVGQILELENSLGGWKPDPKREQRFESPEGVRVDLIPAGPELLDKGFFDWPSGIRMNLVGMRLAFEAAQIVELEHDEHVQVAPPEVVAVLKIAAYMDRPVRQRDLSDLAHILEEAVPEDDDERYGADVHDHDFDYAEAGSFVVGKRIARKSNEEERELVEKFLRRALDENDEATIRQRLIRRGPPGWDSDGEVNRRLEAFAAGVSAESS